MRLADDPPPGGGPNGPAARPRTPQPAFNVPPATLALAAAMLGIFLVLRVIPADLLDRALTALTVIPSAFAGAAGAGQALELLSRSATLVTYAFVHLAWAHLLMNLGFLLAFGSALERALGRRSLIAVFMLSAAGGAGLQLLLEWGAPILVLGASGGVSGLIGGVIRLLIGDPHDPARRRLGFTLLSVVVALDLLFGLLGGAVFGLDAEIAWQTQLGGLIVGLLMVRRPRIDLSV